MADPDKLSDEIPVADAVEQDQETSLEPPAPERDVPPPAEADAFDWHEQRQEIVGADDDRDDYRE
ncbi:hypothetical protein [Mycobacterium shimoidei]|uniref:Uncharacterized protein n=1 Tax=Mycobacterium shimoidei TaxID=29313 RepID=A0A1E3TI43_MYCSH|nr:hypothetical protein [Mycobacterium shimoidei]MCV7257951.1 hypothetical protein [Mycobacterium shimoidei]ODR14109.1 hypothetical protein BHQ16_06630 [Mycobacterium shimoidei]ORW83994.1 hypothetical protein AWC26_00840 [Mycobacterium shimoidei]SRX91807.1 hypothetical protein MSP7336_00028 [Mycobacterium shimoidei]